MILYIITPQNYILMENYTQGINESSFLYNQDENFLLSM